MSDVLVEAQYPYSYKDLDGVNVSFEEGDRFLLLKKANDDWWKVERTQRIDGIKNVIYVPAAYMKEIPDSVSDRSQSSTGLHLPTDKKTDSHNYVNLAELQSVLFQRSKSRSESEQSSDIGSLGTSPRVIPGRSGSSCSDLNGAVSPGVQSNKRNETDEEGDNSDECSSDEDAPAVYQGFRDKDVNYQNLPFKSVSLRRNAQPSSMDNRKSLTLPTLPPGWKKVLDSSTGRPYYFNEVTQESVWKPPRLSLFIESHDEPDDLPDPYFDEAESDQDIPPGWLLENEDESSEKVFVNSVTQERWKACKTSEGQTYYYKIDDDVTETAWQLPRVEVKKRSIRRRSMDDLAEDTKRLTSSMSSSTFPRNSKCKSVVLDYTAGSYQRDSAVFRGPSSSPDLLKKNHRRSQSAFSYDSFGFSSSELTLGEGKATNIPEREGYLSRKKLVEAGKSKKSHWEQVYVCKYGGTLVFYKDQKSATPRPDFPTGKPESSIDLHGAILDTPAKDKVKGKKNVFQLSTYKGSTVMLLMAETTLAMAGWLTPIQNTITKLETEEPLPQMTSLSTDVNNESADSSMSSLSPLSKQPATPTTPTMQTKEKANTTSRSNSTGKDDSKFNIKRRLSKRAGTGEEAEKDKTKIKDKLRKFIIKRPSYSELEKKGIIKQEVFGCHLGKLCQREKCNVPNFVVKCIETVDRKGLNMRGIYRECGNASTMHKLRILIDQGQPVDFNDKQWSDVHMIAGALKWYFRELPDPLIPFDKFDEYVNAIKFPILQERVKRFRDLSKRLPMPNYETLVLLMGHLKRVVEHSSQNKMEAQNVGIVFGPTLLRPEDEEGVMNIALNTVYQNQIVQLMVLEFSAIFDQR